MNELVYAPVLIPTLNRAEHLIRCVESLKKCKYAKETEVYISVDFPPTAAYEEGYAKVKLYLQSGIEGFKEIHIFYQNKNLGAKRNFAFLKTKVFEKFDRFILSEDDNEFSYNFLEYINKGLMIFENDDTVINICSIKSKGPWSLKEETAIYSKICPAYGLGGWREKEYKLEKINKSCFLEDIGKNKNEMNLLWKTSKMCYQQFVEGMLCGKNPLFWKDDDTVNWCDIVRSIYAICENKYFITPKISKVRNWGFDGSGENMKRKKINPYQEWVLDENEDFEYKVDFNKRIIEEYEKYSDKYLFKIPWIYIIKARIKYILYVLIRK